jgi:hypothetical protein
MFIGIPSDSLDTHFAQQRNGMWCWAACIEMLFEIYGVGVSQEMIVDRQFGSMPGGLLPNKPGGFEHMHESLNHFGIDYRGRHYTVMSALYPGPPSPDVIVRELRERRPMLLSYSSRPNMNHAVVLTGAEIVTEGGIQRLKTFVVRDPWPQAENVRRRGRREHPARELVTKTVAHWLIRIAR